jgi:ABC-type Mn2+/Zn2+ transport system permease subunit
MSSILPSPFDLEFMQRGALEVILLAPLAGLLGAQIVLRRLAFFSHSVGTAAFPGLVIAGPLGLPPTLCALAVATLFAAALQRLGHFARIASDSATALLLVAALALGIILASDVYESGSEVDQLLFGSLLAIGGEEIVATVIALIVASVAALLFRRSWIATGFDPAASRALGLSRGAADWALLAAIAVAAVAALDATGALLVGAVLVIPAATARLFATSVAGLELGATTIALAEGIGGLWLAFELDVPPGAAIATLGGIVFGAAAGARAAFRLGAGRRAAVA